MFLFISCLLFFQEILLWFLLIQSKRSMSDEERFVEDNLQMEYLKKFEVQFFLYGKYCFIVLYFYYSYCLEGMADMQNKYNLTLEQNIFLAKRNLVDNVYSNARTEGLNITFPEIKTILDGVNVPNLKIDEIQFYCLNFIVQMIILKLSNLFMIIVQMELYLRINNKLGNYCNMFK